MTLILEDTKIVLGIIPDNLGFDSELLMFINSAKASLVQFGLTEFDIDIDESTSWPTLDTEALTSLTKHYLMIKVKLTFDPTASETIAKIISGSVVELEGRINYEVEEIANS
jgi:hypothetical protein